MRLVLTTVSVFAFGGGAVAQVVRVPKDHPTIAAALGAAAAGSTVLVAPGLYRERVVWPARDRIRLVSEGGPTTTTIDAARLGSALVLASSAISRRTIVEGFTITGGYKVRNGGGIRILDASPTIRRNRIAFNVTAGSGAGLSIAGRTAHPRIIENLIVGNFVQDGDAGAGVAIRDGASAEIIGNQIRENWVVGGDWGRGGGIAAEGAGAVLLASNSIVRNGVQSLWMTYRLAGGGVYLRDTSMTLLNNTIADNWLAGGAFYSFGAAFYAINPHTLVIHGNNVVGNRATATLIAAGGLYHDGARIDGALDWNNVWGNVGKLMNDQTYNLAPGPNHRSVDPQFVGPELYELASGSPLIDVMPATRLPVSVSLDAGRGPRRSDGDRDGRGGNGARLDIGAFELRHASLAAAPRLRFGVPHSFAITATRPSAWVLMFDGTEGNLLVEPFGTFLLTGSALPVVSGSPTPATFKVTVPSVSGLLGTPLLFQAATFEVSQPSVGALSNRLAFVGH